MCDDENNKIYLLRAHIEIVVNYYGGFEQNWTHYNCLQNIVNI